MVERYPFLEQKPKSKNIVFTLKEPLSGPLDNKLIDDLIAYGQSKERIVRICLHTSNAALLHSMLIFLPKGAGYGLHMHPSKNECYTVVDGAIEFSTSSDLTSFSRFRLDSSAPIFYAHGGLWHALRAIDSYALYMEHREGPLIEDEVETIWHRDLEVAWE